MRSRRTRGWLASALVVAACAGDGDDTAADGGTGGGSAGASGAQNTGSGAGTSATAGASTGSSNDGSAASAGAGTSDAAISDAGGAQLDASGVGDGGVIRCDPRQIFCKRVEPSCPEGEVPSVQDNCYGPCVPIDACPCTSADDCPHEEQFTCWLGAKHCGYYVN